MNAERMRTPPLTGGRVGNPFQGGTNKRPAVEDHVTAPAKKVDRTELLRLWQDKWEALECCRIREEELADAGLLVHPLILARVRLSRQGLAVITELRRMTLQELLKQVATVQQSTAQAPQQRQDGGDRPGNPLSDSSNKSPTVSIITDALKELDWTKRTFQGLCLHSWEALYRCHIGEELLGEKGLPLHCLAAPHAQLSTVMMAFIREQQRSETLAFFIRHVVGSGGSPPAPPSAAARQMLKGVLRECSPKDRGVLRQILDRVRPAETSSAVEHR